MIVYYTTLLKYDGNRNQLAKSMYKFIVHPFLYISSHVIIITSEFEKKVTFFFFLICGHMVPGVCSAFC